MVYISEADITYGDKGTRQEYHSQNSYSFHSGSILFRRCGNLNVDQRILLWHIVVNLKGINLMKKHWSEYLRQQVVSEFVVVHIHYEGECSDIDLSGSPCDPILVQSRRPIPVQIGYAERRMNQVDEVAHGTATTFPRQLEQLLSSLMWHQSLSRGCSVFELPIQSRASMDHQWIYFDKDGGPSNPRDDQVSCPQGRAFRGQCLLWYLRGRL